MSNTVIPLDKKRNDEAAVTSPDFESAEYRQWLRTRPGWSGIFDPKEIDKPGGRLVAALVACAGERNQILNDMVRELGVTYGYINQLRNGSRDVTNIADSFAQACADYLGVSRLLVLALAGRVTELDAYAEPNELESEIPRALQYIRSDRKWTALVPESLMRGTFEEQYLVIKLYEKAEKKRLLPETLDLQELFEGTKAVEGQRQERAARILDLVEKTAGQQE